MTLIKNTEYTPYLSGALSGQGNPLPPQKPEQQFNTSSLSSAIFRAKILSVFVGKQGGKEKGPQKIVWLCSTILTRKKTMK